MDMEKLAAPEEEFKIDTVVGDKWKAAQRSTPAPADLEP